MNSLIKKSFDPFGHFSIYQSNITIFTSFGSPYTIKRNTSEILQDTNSQLTQCSSWLHKINKSNEK